MPVGDLHMDLVKGNLQRFLSVQYVIMLIKTEQFAEELQIGFHAFCFNTIYMNHNRESVLYTIAMKFPVCTSLNGKYAFRSAYPKVGSESRSENWRDFHIIIAINFGGVPFGMICIK